MHLLIINERNSHIPGISQLIDYIETRYQEEFFVCTRNQFVNSFEFIEKTKFESKVLLGDFMDHNKMFKFSMGAVDEDLIELWGRLDLPSVWLCFGDLHLGLTRLLLGKEIEVSDYRKTLSYSIARTFQGIAWAFEHQTFNLMDYSVESKSFDPAIEACLLHSYHSEIRSLFSSRLDFPWAIDTSRREFHGKVGRRYRIAVPGKSYLARISFVDQCREHNLKIAPTEMSDRIIRSLFRRYRNLNCNKEEDLRKIEMGIRYTAQQILLRHSEFGFTDGSRLNYFVRKFIEIPSSGSVLVTNMTSYLEAYGFRAGTHFLDCSSSFEALLKKDNRKNNQIRKEMYGLLQNNFDFSVRIEYLLKYLELLLEGKSPIGMFNNGVFGITTSY